jgi:hypothetical protein
VVTLLFLSEGKYKKLRDKKIGKPTLVEFHRGLILYFNKGE